jgi:DME family drug/metabolite transporter
MTLYVELWNNLSMARIQILTAAVLFGTTGTAQALGPHADPATVGAMRIAVGAVILVLLVVFAAGNRRVPRQPVLLVAGLCVAVYQVTFFESVARTGVAVGTVVALGSAPAFAGLFGRIAGRQALPPRWAAATTLASIGVAALALSGGGGEADPAGIALALGAGAGYAGYTVMAKVVLDRGERPEAVMAAAFGTGAVVLLPVLALGDVAWLAGPGGVALALYLGAVPTALAYVLFARGLREVSAAETATLTLAEPLTAALLGVAVLGERPGPIAAAGALLILSGLALLALRPVTAGEGTPAPKRAIAAT